MQIKIAPSLLAADFARLADEVATIEDSADLLHLDLMDNHFVPNLTFGPPVVAALRGRSRLPFDCHLMVNNPHTLVEPLAEAGADIMTVHLEAVPDPSSISTRARELGMGFGVVVSPPTPWQAMAPWLDRSDMVLVMSVHPGFGGQSFMPEVLGKVEALRKEVDSMGLGTDIQIDGGIAPTTIRSARDAGANVFVAGTSVFGRADRSEAINELKKAMGDDR